MAMQNRVKKNTCMAMRWVMASRATPAMPKRKVHQAGCST